jgi:quercetin dioxygenase-like cupin family protein
MRRFPVLVSLVVVMMLGMLALHAQPVAVAQEATPAAGVMEPEGVTFEPIAIASGLTLPSPADMIAIRFNIDPGAGFPLEASDPTAGMLIVESGTLMVRVDAPWTVTRGGSLNTAIATAEATGTFTPADEQITSGEEVTLGAGDAAYIPGNVSG